LSKKKKPSHAPPANTRNANSEALAMLVGMSDSLSVSGYRRFYDCPEIAAGIDVIAGLVSSMTIRQMENTKNGDVRVRDALAKKIDTNPYSLGTRSSWVKWIVRYMLGPGDGNAFVLPVMKDGLLDDFPPMPGASYHSDGDSYKVVWKGKVFTPDEVLHFVDNPDMDEPWHGTGPRIALRDVTDNLKQAAVTRNAYMSDKWRPPLIVKVSGDSSEFDSAKSRHKFAEEYLQTQEHGEPWIIPADLLDVVTVKPMSIADLAINEAVQIDKRTAASILQIPPFLLGVGDFNEKAYNNFIRTRVMQLANTIQQTLTKQILVSPTRYFKLNPRSLYAYSLKEMGELGRAMHAQGLMDGNEVRDWIGLDPRKGLDELVMLENYIPADKLGDQKKLIQNEEDDK